MPFYNRKKLAWPDHRYYFITIATFLHYPYFRGFDHKMLALDKLKEIEKRLNVKFSAFSIAINHIHLLVYLEKGEIFSKLMQLLCGGISHDYGKSFGKKYDEMWQDRKIIIVYDDEALERVEGYIAGNLIKHKEINNFHDLFDDPFCSFKKLAEKRGLAVAKEIVCRVINISENPKGEVDYGNLQLVKFTD